jgi:hypothetical protein
MAETPEVILAKKAPDPLPTPQGGTNIQQSANKPGSLGISSTNAGGANALGGTAYGGGTPNNISAATTPQPTAPIVSGSALPTINIAPSEQNPNAIPQLDPAVMNKIVTIKGPTGGIPDALQGMKAQTKSDIALIGQMDHIRQVLRAYNHVYQGSDMVDAGDVAALKTLGDKNVNRFLTAYTRARGGSRPGGAWTQPGTYGANPSKFLAGGALQSQGLLTQAANMIGGGGEVPTPGSKEALKLAKDTTGFATGKDLKAALKRDIAKIIPGLNPDSLSDPLNVMNVAVPSSLMDKLGTLSNALMAGQTFDQIYQAKDHGVPILTPKAAKAAQNQLANIPTIDYGAQSAESAYQGLIALYKERPGDVIQTLEDAGKLLPGPNATQPTPFQVYSAFAALVTQAANSNTSVAQEIQTSTDQFKNNQNNTAALIGPQASMVAAAAANLGVQLTPDQQTGLITEAENNNWQQGQVDQAVAGFFSFTPGMALTGRAAQIATGMQTLYQDYMPGQTLPQATLGQFLNNAIKGVGAAAGTTNPVDAAGDSTGTSAALANFKQYVQGLAASQFPEFGMQITQGVPTKTLLDPYGQLAASLLGFGSVNGTGQASINETQDATASLGINWNDPKWQRLIRGGEGGRPMSLDQARNTIITDPQYGWTHTDMAQNLASHVGDALLETFGFYKPGGQTSALG